MISISRTVTTGAASITETAAAPLPDRLVLSLQDEANTTTAIASALFAALPGCRPWRPVHNSAGQVIGSATFFNS
jgi:hypothetical protein